MGFALRASALRCSAFNFDLALPMNAPAQFLALLGTVAIALLSSGLRPVWLIPAYGVLALAALVGWLPARRAGLSVRTVPCLVATAVFFGYILCRTVFSPVEYTARADLFMVLGGLIVYLVTALCATSPTSRLVFTSVFLLLACAQVFAGAVQFTKGDNFMPFDFLPRSEYGARASGFYGCPNHLAGFLEVVLLMSLSMAFWSRWRLMGKILAGYVAVACAAGVVMSGSRGGYASAAAGLLTFAILSLWLARQWLRRDIWLLLVTVLVFASIGLGFVAYSAVHGSDFLAFRVKAAGVDAPFRFALWRAAIKQFCLNPIFGTGSGTYLYFGREFREAGVTQDPVYAHSDYLQLLAEFGLAAIAGLAFFLAVHLRSGWKFIADVIAGRTEDADREAPGFHGNNSLALTVGAMCSVVACLLHSIGDFNLHIPPNTLIMAFLFGSLANPFSVLHPEPKAGTARVRKFLRCAPLALPALGLWLACAALPKWPAENYAEKSKVLLSDWRSLEEPEVAERAAELARQGLRRDPRNIELYFCLGDSAAALAEMTEEPAAREDHWRQAIEAGRRGLQIAPREVRFVLMMARAFDALGQFDKSEPLFRRALELDPNDGSVLMDYGAHLHLLLKFDEAEVWYRKAGERGCASTAIMNLRRLEEDRKAAAKAR